MRTRDSVAASSAVGSSWHGATVLIVLNYSAGIEFKHMHNQAEK